MKTFRIVLAVSLEHFVDLTPVALRLREVALTQARKHLATVDVVTVENPVSEVTGMETTEEKLARFMHPFREFGIEARGHLLCGKPSERIREFSEKVDADCLIIASHSTPCPRSPSLGSTAAALLKTSARLLWIVHPTRREVEKSRRMRLSAHPFIPIG
jgi:nucleotide-binding universal stress UspA family protein